MKIVLKISGTIVIIIALVLMSPDINPFDKIGGFFLATLFLFCGFGLCEISNAVDKINQSGL